MSTTTPKSLRIGVMLEKVQLMDISGIDMFSQISRETMSDFAAHDPRFVDLLAHSVDITFYYIASTVEPTPLYLPNFRILPTITYDDCPRDLDILLIGGPMLTHRPEPADRFLKEAWSKTRVVMTTCTGSLWLASAGVLKGLKCTTNQVALPPARMIHPDSEWLERRWVVEDKEYEGEGKGELWTAGGATAGLDMIATYCLKNFNQDLVQMCLNMLDINPVGKNGQDYQ